MFGADESTSTCQLYLNSYRTGGEALGETWEVLPYMQILQNADPSLVHSSPMPSQMATLFKGAPAGLALVWPLPSVGSLVVQQVRSLGKFFLARPTLVGSLARMDSLVNNQVVTSGERLLAHLATEWFLARVGPHVNL